jgi:hypothetical protein
MGRFLFVTTSEKKTGFLLIETFRKTKLWPPGFVPWWHSCNAWLVRISEIPVFNADLDYRYTGFSAALLVADGFVLELP